MKKGEGPLWLNMCVYMDGVVEYMWLSVCVEGVITLFWTLVVCQFSP